MEVAAAQLIPAVVFIAVVLFVWSLYLLLPGGDSGGAGQVKRRMGNLAAAGQRDRRAPLSLARSNKVSGFDGVLLALPQFRAFDRYLMQAGVAYGPSAALARLLASGLVPAGSLYAAGFGSASLLLAFLFGAGVWTFRLARKRRQRRARMVRQLPDAMDFFARALRAGNPFIGALKAAPEEMPQPLAREFEITFEELNYGLDFEEVMQNLARRTDAEEVRFFVTAVLVQKTTGGNLAEIMNRISSLLRERIKTRGEVEIQAAEMKASAHVLIALPFFVAGILHLMNPEYFMVLFENQLGRYIVYAQLGLMLVGYLIIRRMVNFRI